MKSTFIKLISERIYSLFVVNSAAAGIQQNNGVYLTKYIPVSPMLIENMIAAQGSIGCYQQGMNTEYIKWICFDFDCKDKSSPKVKELDGGIVKSLTDVLDALEISYLKEFSGRRGIHIWIIFDCIIKKRTGYIIEQELLRRAQIREDPENEWGLDLFPATDSGRGNKVGKQVKFPLSSHKNGGMSYFFCNDFEYIDNTGTEVFFQSQLDILSAYSKNEVFKVLKSLGLDDCYQKESYLKYKKYRLFGCVDISTEKVIEILSETKVYDNIFERMRNGLSMQEDWVVLMGTLSRCDEKSKLLHAILEEFPNYDIRITNKNLNKLKDRYYPATFGYLYHIYNLNMEEWLNPESTGLAYLIERLGLSDELSEEYSTINEHTTLLDIYDTTNKEREYLQYNDESIDVYTWNKLCSMKKYDIELLQKRADQACKSGNYNDEPGHIEIYKRFESDEKKRSLVSLSADDRVLTTFLAIKLYSLYEERWKSYSYRPMITSSRDIFFSWYSAWGNYISKIRTFIEVPFFSDYEVMYIDLKGFYDHIDFLTVFKTLTSTNSVEFNNILNYLLGFNDKIMSSINFGNRIGVPQGPAYARIISEMFLSKVIDIATIDMKEHIYVYRYVDDIVVISQPGYDSKKVFNHLCRILNEYGLPVNTEKSDCFGSIGELTNIQRDILLHTESYNYDLRIGDKDHILLASERDANVNHYLNDRDFEIKSLGYVFSDSTLSEAKERCFDLYRSKIISSEIGRGINFRRFYEYVLTHDEYILTILNEGLLSQIPVNSVNFSNFLCTLYLVTQSEKMSPRLFGRIQKEFLSSLDATEVGETDYSVVKALLMIKWEDNHYE